MLLTVHEFLFKRTKIILLLFAVSLTGLLFPQAASTGTTAANETHYLLFQMFTNPGVAAPSQSQTYFPPLGDLEASTRDIITRIRDKGDRHNKLGVCLGPLTFSNSDEQVRQLIKEGFAMARKNDIAIAFHIDDQMFWSGRKDLNNKDNIEWTDWKGTLCTGRRLDWSEKPAKAPPQLCLNSPAVQQAVKQRASLIASEIRKELFLLKRENKEHLFAGVIAGWESMIGSDYDTNKQTGYHALSNKTYSSATDKRVLDAALVQTLHEFIELWARQLAAQGIPANKIYCHFAFTEQGLKPEHLKGVDAIGFATPDLAFDKLYRPGFSTYPEETALEQIQQVLLKHATPPWISAEGTNVVPNGMSGEATMETYLGKMFNHGAVMVNIFSWGIGGEAERDRNIFRKATESAEALAAYRKFLSGKVLREEPRPANQFSPTRFRAKIEKIQSNLHNWVEKTQRLDLVQPLMLKLDTLIKSGRFEEANATADQILKLICQ